MTLYAEIHRATRFSQLNVRVSLLCNFKIQMILGISRNATFTEALNCVNDVYTNDIMALDSLERELSNEEWSAILETSIGFLALGAVSLHTEL